MTEADTCRKFVVPLLQKARLAFINNEEATRPDGKKGASLFRYLCTLTSSNGDDRREVIATVFKGVAIFRHREFLENAAAHFTGTAGQQRVPASFRREKKPLIRPRNEQTLIVAELDALQAQVDALKRLQAETAAEPDGLLPARLDRAFKGQL